MNELRSISVICSLCFSPILSISQEVEARILSFNESIGNSYSMSNKGANLIIEGFREGKRIKRDKVNIHELDFASLKFSEDENAVVLKCFSDMDGCVNRVLVNENKKSYRNRILFAIPPDGVSGEEIATKLRMVLNEMSKKY